MGTTDHRFDLDEAAEFHALFHQDEEAGSQQSAEVAAPLISRRKRAELAAVAANQRQMHATRQKVAENSAATKGWQSARANMIGAIDDDPAPPRPRDLHEQFGPDHTLLYAGGFFFCKRCGATSTGQNAGTSGLLKQCSRKEATGGTSSRLRRLMSGALPRTHPAWPDTTGGTAHRHVQHFLS